MANILRLAKENISDTAAKVDLLSGGLRLARGGYQPTAGPRYAGQVQEVIKLVEEDTPANLFDAVTEIEDLLSLAALWHKDPYQYESIWLEVTSDGEAYDTALTGARRALLYDGILSLTMPDGFRGAFLDNAAFANLQITRHRWFENPTYKNPSTTLTNCWGNEWDITGQSAYSGDAPARIENLEIRGLAGNIDKAWLGIRPEHGGITGFEPLWELEDGTAGTDTTFGAESGASGSDAATCTFATSTDLEERVSIEMSDVVVSNYNRFIGRYLVLLRCKVGASTTCGVKMSYGIGEATVQQETVYIDNTAWELIELGEIQIPPTVHKWAMQAAEVWGSFKISLEGSQISGSGDLILDALYLMPSEHLFTISDIAPSSAPNIWAFTLPDDRHFARIEEGNVLTVDPTFTMNNFYLPVDPGLLMVQVQATTGHVLTEDPVVQLWYYPRWNLYRTR